MFDGLMYVVMILLGGYFLMTDKITAADMTAYLLYIGMLIAAIKRIVEFTEQSAQYAQMVGATLEHVTSGPIYDQFSEGMHTVYHLTYRTEGMPLKIKIPASVKKHNVNPYAYRTFFTVNNLVYDEYFGVNDLLGEVETDDEGAVEIYMNQPDSKVQIGNLELKENSYMAVINFVDRADATVFVLVCTLDLSE